MKSPTQKYYLVSDLHMGGDGALQHCDYTAEFIEFLKGLEKEGPDTELLIVGDTFGFWELTLVQGVEKLDHIVAGHQAIFDQLRTTGERIKITMMVGNHDYDLACKRRLCG
jgi:UDP-2,3-diacylglucosamine pyrophosphatase LpxH